MAILRIGTRGSRLAVWQTEYVAQQIKKNYPEIEIIIKIIKTKGDAILDKALSKIGDKGLFTGEIEQDLREGNIDMAVHSLKDMPAVLAEEFCIGAVLPRENPRDALLSNKKYTFKTLPVGATIGTSSLRRVAQLKALRPDINCIDLRGNLDTRIKKMQAQDLDGIILAYAGIKRLNLEHLVTDLLGEEIILPAAAQGAIAVEVRSNDKNIVAICSKLMDKDTWAEVSAERSFLLNIQGGCQVPVACRAILLPDDKLYIKGLVASLDGRQVFRHEEIGLASQAQELGKKLASYLLNQGADSIITEFTK